MLNSTYIKSLTCSYGWCWAEYVKRLAWSIYLMGFSGQRICSMKMMHAAKLLGSYFDAAKRMITNMWVSKADLEAKKREAMCWLIKSLNIHYTCMLSGNYRF
jgi:hypothetical protein